jgi:hypothetical protein
MSARHALGDFSFVFLLLLVLAWIAHRYAPTAVCFTLAPGGGCDFPGAVLLFTWGFTFQVTAIPLGLPMAIYATIQMFRRVRRRSIAV